MPHAAGRVAPRSSGTSRLEGIKLYAVSYDDTEALAAYVGASGVEFTMLSDVDSDVINRYGVLNTLVQPDDVPFYGVPFPGFFLLDEDGVIVDKLFNRHLANREGVEAILDSFLGRVEPGLSEPVEMVTEDDGIRITAFLRGGGGVLRIGPRRASSCAWKCRTVCTPTASLCPTAWSPPRSTSKDRMGSVAKRSNPRRRGPCNFPASVRRCTFGTAPWTS